MARILCPPLWGTRLFPLCAKQERVHFDIATNGPVGHYDGEPDRSYDEHIKEYMKRMFGGWDHDSTDINYLQEWSTSRAKDYEQKFPFSIHRFGVQCYTKKEIAEENLVHSGAIRASNTPASDQPPNRTGGCIVAGANIRTKSDPRTSTEDLKVAKVNLSHCIFIIISVFKLKASLRFYLAQGERGPCWTIS